jgi:hypothetical protein
VVPLLVTVNVVAPLLVTVLGLKVAVAPIGNPLTPKLTAPLKPFSGETFTA